MFSQQLRRAVARTASSRFSIPQKRRFGGSAHDDHHHVEYMSTKSELPPGDWRDKPMHWDFSVEPRSDYERFVASRLSGPDDPLLKLTKGQFIVHMRRLAREERGYAMFQGRVAVAIALFGFAYISNRYYKPFDVVNNTFTDLQYQTIFEKPLLNGPNFETPNFFRLRLDEFFADHDEATIAKLPQELQDVYNKYKDSYNENYTSQGPMFYPNNADLSPAGLAAARAEIMSQHNLNEEELNHIITTCDPIVVIQQTMNLSSPEEVKAFDPDMWPIHELASQIRQELDAQRRLALSKADAV